MVRWICGPTREAGGEVCWASPRRETGFDCSNTGDGLSKTKRKTPIRGFETRPLERHVPKRQCDSCREWYLPEEISQDRDDAGRVTGWFCGGCI